tara:strand:+ start:37 stop:1839 length:1803 start_codon:yes stop_codon:yes gene_type:complete
MAVLRSDQAQLTFAAETSPGADPEMIEGTTSGAYAVINLSAGLPKGSRAVTFDGLSGTFVVGDLIRIGEIAGTAASTVTEHEVRRIEIVETTILTLDRPTAFFHPDNDHIKRVTTIVAGDAIRNDADKYITFIPGVYDTIDTPDPEMSFEGKRFLSTASKRNWSVAYPGQQTLTGSVSNFILLNGWPLRFPIGTVATVPQTVASDAIAINLSGGSLVGDVFVPLDGGDIANLGVGDYIQLGSGATSEVRKIIQEAGSTDTFKLNYPLSFAHPDNEAVNEVAGGNTYYDHTITETVDLSTVSWHVHMVGSDEDYDRKFDRRYVGGMVGSATISADEGGMLSMSWDGVNFLNMIHNQTHQTTVSTNGPYGGSSMSNMPRYGLMQTIDSDDVGTPGYGGTAGGGAVSLNAGLGYPNTQPYYFSQGQIKFFGTEFARIRSFNLSISNGEEPRYYIGRQGSRNRGPYEIKEGPREYSMSATVALPDLAEDNTTGHSSSTQDHATELFKQLLLEGDYGGSTAATARAGFTASLRFDRGTNDYIIIDIPGSSTAGTPTGNTNNINSQGIFINTAQHAVTGDNPFQVDLSMLFRSLNIYIRDAEPIYP